VTDTDWVSSDCFGFPLSSSSSFNRGRSLGTFQKSNTFSDVRATLERTILLHISANKVWPQLKGLDIGLSPRVPGFDHGSGHVRYVVDKVTLRQAFLGVIWFFVSIIPPKFYTHLNHNITPIRRTSGGGGGVLEKLQY
jgi:hypothetical protein